MNSTKISVIIAGICIIIAIVAFALMGGREPVAQPYVFGRMPQNISRIELTTPKDHFDLVLEDGYWKIPQKNNYYANSLAVLYLFNSFKKAKLTQKVEFPITPANSITIRVFGGDKQVVAVDIFDQNNNKYAKVDGNIYLVSGLFDLPEDIISWVEQPILDIAAEQVQSIELNGRKATRSDYDQPLAGSLSLADAQGLLKIIKYVYFEDVRPLNQFSPEHFSSHPLAITTFDGLITKLTLYSDDQNYWLSKSLAAAPITRKGVNEYIKSRGFLFDGWIFKIPSYYGKGLLSYALAEENNNHNEKF